MAKQILSSLACSAMIIGLTPAAFATPTQGQKYNSLEDAAVAQAKIWQSGGKAKPLMSADGKVIFAFGQSMPKLTCSPNRACDVEMEPGEKVKKIILADSANWESAAAESIERGKVVQHVIFQPRDSDLETNTIITTDHRTYHIKLYAPKAEGAYLNRVGFYYPEDLVTSWADKMGGEAAVEVKEESQSIMPAAVGIERLAFDYRVEGSAEFKPERVFNDGERVYIEMSGSSRTGGKPVLLVLDENGKGMVVDYHVNENQSTGTCYYIVDKLFSKAELILGSKKISISWKRKEKSFWGFAE